MTRRLSFAGIVLIAFCMQSTAAAEVTRTYRFAELRHKTQYRNAIHPKISATFGAKASGLKNTKIVKGRASVGNMTEKQACRAAVAKAVVKLQKFAAKNGAKSIKHIHDPNRPRGIDYYCTIGFWGAKVQLVGSLP